MKRSGLYERGGPYAQNTCDKSPNAMTGTVSKLIAAFPSPKLEEASRVEVQLLPDNAVVTVSVDAEEWYSLLKTGPDFLELADAAAVGQGWVDRTRQSVSPTAQGPDFLQRQEPSRQLIPCRFWVNSGFCRNKESKTCEFNHDSVYCKAVVKSRANVLSTCGFMIDKGMRVPLSNSKKWEYVLARAQHREVMMIPSLTTHLRNEDLMSDPAVWTDVLAFCQKTGACSVALNLGIWESGHAFDRYMQSCHGHIHIYYEEAAWKNLMQHTSSPRKLAWGKPVEKSQRVALSPELISLMTDRNRPPASYKLADCNTLESGQLRHDFNQLLLKALRSTSTEVAALKCQTTRDRICTAVSETR